ncbi:hypothetical protein D3C72_85500 [compost metagenome]
MLTLTALTLPFVRGRKWIKKWTLSERSEFRPLPIFCPAQTGTPKGQRLCGRLSLLTFFGEAKKVSGCRAAPGMALPTERKRYQQKITANQASP